MRRRYFVTYDIADDRIRSQVYKLLRGYGDHIQFSVFRCDLGERRKAELVAALHELIDHGTDQILVIDLGDIDGRAANCVSSIGCPYTNPERTVVIV